jgi:hypothetical protein
VPDTNEPSEPDEPNPRGVSALSPKVIIGLVVVALFAGVIAAKVLAPRPEAVAGAGNAVTTSVTSVHNDAVSDYQAALKAGRPIYVLFHSLS